MAHFGWRPLMTGPSCLQLFFVADVLQLSVRAGEEKRAFCVSE